VIFMSEPAVTRAGEPVAGDERLYAAMLRLLVAYADRQTSETPAPRGVVERRDALDAVIQIGAEVDQAVQAGAIDVDRGMHVPPDWVGDRCTDYLEDDLAMMVTALRKARQATGRKG
jgi:hypothetical protein